MLTALLLAAALPASSFDQVVAAERGFAAMAIKAGRHQAFLATLTDDAITFNPDPQPARPLHENQPPPQGSLQWAPGWVAVSAAGDLAVSAGPWRIEVSDNPIVKGDRAHGWFISMWRRQAGGRWKVGVDAGVSGPMTYSVPEPVVNGTVAPPASGPLARDASSAKQGILAAEKAFEAAARGGIGGAVAAVADPFLRVYREQKALLVGAKESQAGLAADARKAACSTDKIVAAKSGDLGYTYGTCAGLDADTDKYGFLHVWRIQADGSWKVLVDVTP